MDPRTTGRNGFVHFAHRVTLFADNVTLFAQRVTLEQIFVGPIHVKNEIQEMIWTVQFFKIKSWP